MASRLALQMAVLLPGAAKADWCRTWTQRADSPSVLRPRTNAIMRLLLLISTESKTVSSGGLIGQPDGGSNGAGDK